MSFNQQAVRAMNSVDESKINLYQTNANQLHNFIKNLKPNDFNNQVRNVVHRMCDFLKDRLKHLPVIKVVKGGSFGKGTALKNNSDADLVVFLDCFHGYLDQRKNRRKILEEIRETLTSFGSTKTYETEDIIITVPRGDPSIPPRSISFTIHSKKTSEMVEFDLLPAFDAVGRFGDEAYVELIKIKDLDGEFSTCFTERQRSFVKDRPEQLKDLIRLMKHWYKVYVKPRRCELIGGNRLPQKYAVELLTIHAWEVNGSLENFSIAQGFRTVLKLICRYQELCIHWNCYYKLDINTNEALTEFVKRKLCDARPIILDPADPTGNVGQSGGWHVMANEASKCLQMPCSTNVQLWEIKPVKEIEITVKLLAGSMLRINVNPFMKVSTIKEEVQKNWYHFSPKPQTLPVPTDQQRLMFNDNILNDNKTLLESGISYNATITLLVTTMDIFVRFPEGNTKTFNVQLTDTVLSLKKKIEAQSSISQYYLVCNGKTLEDRNTLEHYNIKKNETIYITLRLRGGSLLSI